jgi:hypothetical protein
VSGKLDDPRWRHERAVKAGRASAAASAELRQRIKIDAAVKELVANAPELTPEHLSKLRAVLAPALSEEQTRPLAS